MMTRFGAVIGLCLFFSACGPIYNTDYQFTPPSSTTGRVCTQQCENSKFQCQQMEEMSADRCRDRAQIEQQRCEDNIRWREGRDPKWYECGAESCSANTDRCDAQYRSCYQACGGRVDAHTYCVANCSQVPAAQQAPAPAVRSKPVPKPYNSKKSSNDDANDPYRRY